MRQLEEFVDWLNNDIGGSGQLPSIKNEGLTKTYGEAMQQSLERHYAEDRQAGGLRMSNIGKPAVQLALNQLGYVEPEPRGKLRYIFHTGDMFENWLECMLQVAGIPILLSQGEVEFEGVKGHYDFIVEIEGVGPVLLEAKTMSANYARQFKKYPNDDRGYVSQLALYAHCVDLPAAWINMDKGLNEIFITTPAPAQLDDARARAKTVIKAVRRVESLEQVLYTSGGYFRPPPPVAERYQSCDTGRFLLPQSMRYSPFKSVVYQLSYERNNYNKDTIYVEGVQDLKDARQELDKLVEEGTIWKI